MVSNVIMPQGGQDIETGRVIRWYRAPGETVRKGEPICDVETEKTVIEVTAPRDGVLLATYVAEGQEARVFTMIAAIGDPGDVPPAAGPPAGKVEAAQAAPVARPLGRDAPRAAHGRRLVTPRAKRLADEQGIDLERITGTGPQGSITADDVLNARPAAPRAEPEHGRTVAMSRIGRVTARRMALSKQAIPHFYVSMSIDMTAAVGFREVHNARTAAGDSLSLTDLITRACALALREVPEVNCSVKEEGQLVRWEDVHIGIATATDEGLVVPVLENADRLTLPEIGVQTRRIVSAARAGKQVSTAPARFTLSNLGMFGVDNFVAIINPPEVAILAVGAVMPMVLPAPDGTLQARQVMQVTLSMDHRAGDGLLAARFLNCVKKHLEDPATLG